MSAATLCGKIAAKYFQALFMEDVTCRTFFYVSFDFLTGTC